MNQIYKRIGFFFSLILFMSTIGYNVRWKVLNTRDGGW